ncbi:hypothetical protein Tco_0028685 [Tanacetum coccineum]
MKRASKGFSEEDILLFRAMIVQGPVVQGEGSTHPTPVANEAASTCMDVRYGGAATTVTGLEAGQGSELTVLCTTLSKKVENLEEDLKQTKQIYGAVYTKLIKKVKKWERAAKSNQARRKTRIVVSDDEDDLEDSSKQGGEIQGRHEQDMEFESEFDDAKEVYTAKKEVSTAKPVSTAGAEVAIASVSTASPTRVSTADDITLAETLVYIRKSAAKYKGKGKMVESEPAQIKTKLQQEQERLGYKAAVRFQDQLDEEERQRITKVHESASSFSVEEWENMQA